MSVASLPGPGHPIWASLGVDPAAIDKSELIQDRDGRRVFRVWAGGSPAILKLAAGAGHGEAERYDLLRAIGVRTPGMLGAAPGALLLEDLETSRKWRLASRADLSRAEAGEAVATWYLQLHTAGRRWLESRQGPDTPSGPGLDRETDVLTPESITETARLLGLRGLPVWALAAGAIVGIRMALACLPATLTYNDFDAGNLALSRSGRRPEAVIFDYHLLGIGLAFSDWRNVTGGLISEGREAFAAAYGPTDPTEQIFDRPLSVLVGLHVAARRPRFPSWGAEVVEAARSGELEAGLRALVELVQGRHICRGQAIPG